MKWAVEVTRLEDLPRIVRRAAKIATTPPTGPVFISLPGDILNAEAGIELGCATRVDTRQAIGRIAEIAGRADTESGAPVIIVGDEIVKSDALQGGSTGGTLGCPAPVVDALRRPFPVRKPLLSRALARIQKLAREALSPYDLIIALGGDPLRMSVYSEVDPLPDGSIVQIGLVDWDLARNYSAEIALKARRRRRPCAALVPALKALAAARVAREAGTGSAGLEELTAKRKMLVDQISRAGVIVRRSIRLAGAAGGRGDARNAILVDEGLTSSRQIIGLRPHRDRYGYHALASGASAGPLRPRSASASSNPLGRWCVILAMAARCIRSSRCGPRRTTSCR